MRIQKVGVVGCGLMGELHILRSIPLIEYSDS